MSVGLDAAGVIAAVREIMNEEVQVRRERLGARVGPEKSVNLRRDDGFPCTMDMATDCGHVQIGVELFAKSLILP